LTDETIDFDSISLRLNISTISLVNETALSKLESYNVLNSFIVAVMRITICMTLLPNSVFYFGKSLLTLKQQLSFMLSLLSIFEISKLLKPSPLFQLVVALSHDVFLTFIVFLYYVILEDSLKIVRCCHWHFHICSAASHSSSSSPQSSFQVKLYGFGRSHVIAGILKKSSFSGSCCYRSELVFHLQIMQQHWTEGGSNSTFGPR
jgi:hypothetical protein